MAQAFDVMSLLNDKSKEDVKEKEIINIEYDKIIENENNMFPIVEIEEMANSLVNLGLQQNLVVRYLDNGSYELLSGARRLNAIRYIFENNLKISEERKAELKKPICKVIQSDLDKTLQKLMLFETNIQSRDNSDWTQLGLVKEYLDTLKECEEKKLIENVSGNVKKIIAQKFNVSERTAVKMNVVLNSDNEDVLNEVKEGETSINKAYEKLKEKAVNEYAELEKEIAERLDTKVVMKKKTITISFENETDLQRILEILSIKD